MRPTIFVCYGNEEMKYIVFNETGEILRNIECSRSMRDIQAKEGKFVMEGKANDVTQKIEFDGFDVDGQPINPRVVDKTPQEIAEATYTPEPVPFEKQIAYITNEQWQDVLDRLKKLEIKV